MAIFKENRLHDSSLEDGTFILEEINKIKHSLCQKISRYSLIFIKKTEASDRRHQQRHCTLLVSKCQSKMVWGKYKLFKGCTFQLFSKQHSSLNQEMLVF
jgi:hypothetical protein